MTQDNKEQKLLSCESIDTMDTEAEIIAQKREYERIRKTVYLFTACAALNSVNLGYDIGINANATKLVQDAMDLTNEQVQMFNGCLNLFAMIGALKSQYISDTLGRRRSFQASSLLFIIGIIPLSMATSFSMLLFGKVFVGLGVGFGLSLDPVYISEISPAMHRGRLVNWSEVAINIGILLGLSSGLIFYQVDANVAWRYMYGAGAIMPPILFVLAQFVMPESPRWLIQRGRNEEAFAILQKIYPKGSNLSIAIQDIQSSIESEIASNNVMGWGLILNPPPAYRRMLLLGVFVSVAQQLVGIESVLYYLVYIIEHSNIESRIVQGVALMVLGIIKLIFILIASEILDRKGRRPLFFSSLAGMAVSLLFLSYLFYTEKSSGIYTIIALGMYLAAFSLGMGPCCWLIPSEIFTNTIRAKGMSISTFANRLTATIMSSTFLSMAYALTWPGFFLLLAANCGLAAMVIYFYLPETNGVELEDMAKYFAEITNDDTILEMEESLAQTCKNAEEKSKVDMEMAKKIGVTISQ